MKLKISDIEFRLNKKIKRNYSVVGFDTSSKAGVCFAKTDDTYIHLDWTTLTFETSDQRKMYAQMFQEFGQLITSENLVIIEEVFVSFNPKVALFLARMGTLVLANCLIKNIPFEFLSAISARSKLGINTRKAPKGKSKEYVAQWLKENLNFDIEQNDIADALILCLNGIVEGTVFKKLKTNKKRKK